MNKKYIKIILVILSTLVLSLFSGCSGLIYDSYVSEIRDNIFLGETEHFEVSVYTGFRENPYKADGLANDMVSYFLVIVEPKFDTTDEDILNMSVVIKNKVYAKSVTKDVLREKFIADYIKLDTFGNFTINVQVLNYDEDVAMIEMFNAGMKTYEEALREGMEKLKDKFDRSKDKNKYNCEIYVKLCVSRFLSDKKLFWHVTILDSLGNVNGVIVEVE